MLLLLEAQEGNWDEIDLMVRAFQGVDAGAALRRRAGGGRPAGLTLGGGCEIALHADRVQAAAESYIGLVEVGVGLIPGRRRNEGDARARGRRTAADTPICLPFVQRVFETIGFAKVSTSAADARRLGFLDDADRVTMNRERLIADAKAYALERVREGYQAPAPRTAIPVGGEACWPRSSSASTWRGARDESATTTRSSAARSPTCWRAARCRIRRRSASSTCSTSSARRS